MSSFLKIVSNALLSLSLAAGAAGCVAASGDEDEGDDTAAEEIAKASAAADSSTPSTSPCGPGTLLQTLGLPPGYYGAGFYPGLMPTSPYGGLYGGMYPGYGGPVPGYGGLGYGYGYGLYNPGYYAPVVGNPCGCAPTNGSSTTP